MTEPEKFFRNERAFLFDPDMPLFNLRDYLGTSFTDYGFQSAFTDGSDAEARAIIDEAIRTTNRKPMRERLLAQARDLREDRRAFIADALRDWAWSRDHDDTPATPGDMADAILDGLKNDFEDGKRANQ